MIEVKSFKLPLLTEADLDIVLANAGGVRIHPDHDQRERVGADYRLGDTLIELKLLDDEGLDKAERRAKLHKLFREIAPGQCAVTLNRNHLLGRDRAQFDYIIEGPIKAAIKKANTQLKQSRTEFPDTKRSILLLVNNAYMSLDHETILERAAHRVRQDTTHIDAVVVAGSYYHGDSMGGYLVWPMTLIPIRQGFVEFDRLHASWEAFGDRFMDRLAQHEPERNRNKGPISDIQFEVEGVAYTRPAPDIEGVASIFAQGLLRKSYTDGETITYVAITRPNISRSEWSRLRDIGASSSELLDSYEMWTEREAQARKLEVTTCPFVTISVTADDWAAWCKERGTIGLVSHFANESFESRLRDLKSQARDRRKCVIIPARYTLAVTTILGSDDITALSSGSRPMAWCRSGGIIALFGLSGRFSHAATAGSMMIGSSLSGAIVSSVM